MCAFEQQRDIQSWCVLSAWIRRWLNTDQGLPGAGPRVRQPAVGQAPGDKVCTSPCTHSGQTSFHWCARTIPRAVSGKNLTKAEPCALAPLRKTNRFKSGLACWVWSWEKVSRQGHFFFDWNNNLFETALTLKTAEKTVGILTLGKNLAGYLFFT